MSKQGSKIIAGLRDAVAHAKGERSGVKIHTVHIPVINVKAVSNKLGMTQSEFALRFSFPLGTLRG